MIYKQKFFHEQTVYDTNKLLIEIILINHETDNAEVMKFLRQEDEYITSSRPDLIVIDLSLPRKEGAEALAKIKQIPSLLDVPIVILTTSEIQSTVFQTYGLTADAFITKPIDSDQFLITVASLL
ncbi:MAG: response regulator [Promethearchaeota archaeon]